MLEFAVNAFEEPDSSFLNWAGESNPRDDVVERNASLQLSGRKKVGCGEEEVVVTDASGDAEHTAGAFAVFGGNATVLHLDGANGIGADAQLKIAIGRLSDVEAVEESKGLISGGARDMGLAG